MNGELEVMPHYGAAAFDSSKLCTLPAPRKATGTGVNGWLKEPLNWGGYSELEPPTEINNQLESQKHKDKQDIKEPNTIIEPSFKNSVNWSFERGGKISLILINLKWQCFFFPWVFWGVKATENLQPLKYSTAYELSCALLMVILGGSTFAQFGTKRQTIAYWMMLSGCLFTGITIIWKEGALWGFWLEQTAFWWGAGLFFMAYIGCDVLLGIYSHFYKWDGSEFNRQTGMVTISGSWWHFKLVAPFYEFDAQLQLVILPLGGHDCILWLQHRYTGRNLCLGNRVHSLGLSRNEALVTWDSLQRYMDISQPLPDQPILESTRHLDPTTAAHDLATNRPPRYWRDMKNKAWNRTAGNDLRDKIAAYPWQQQPCLIKAHTDPALSVAAYYARQENHGIQARSGGRPIMEIHG